jgi:hypothetical protein
LTVRASLRAALRDFYENSWRLVPLNVALAAALVVVLVAASYAQLALALLVLLFPLALALMHSAVLLAREGVFVGGSFAVGLRAHWRRGLQLGLLNAVVLGGGAFGVLFYLRGSAATWPLAFVLLYIVVAFCVYQVVLWPLAIEAPRSSLRALLRAAAVELLRRPGSAFVLVLALALVNLAGVAAALLPFLTLTIAYSFLAAAHFVLAPREPKPGAA